MLQPYFRCTQGIYVYSMFENQPFRIRSEEEQDVNIMLQHYTHCLKTSLLD